MSDPAPFLKPTFRPLNLPVGSVRALLLLTLLARVVLDLRAGHAVADWLMLALIVSGAAYFAARAAGPGVRAERPPLGVPAGTVRLLVLAGVGYAGWLYAREHPVDWRHLPTLWVLAAFVVGVVMRLLLTRLRIPEDSSTPRLLHVQALLTLVAAGGLVVLALRPEAGTPGWVEPLLAAATTYYAGAR